MSDSPPESSRHIIWCVLWRDGSRTCSTVCGSRQEAQALAAETNRVHPGLGAWADWHFATVRGD